MYPSRSGIWRSSRSLIGCADPMAVRSGSVLVCGDDERMTRPRAGCWNCSRCSRRAATGPAPSWPSAWRCPGARSGATSTGCASSATRSTRSPAPRAVTGCAPGTAMPPLLLDDDEAIAIAVGLRTAARASVAGIEETARPRARQARAGPARPPAPPRRRARVGHERAPGRRADGRPPAPDLLAAACRDTERLRFAYRSRDGAESRREVEPHALVNLGRRWYLVAWDRGREDWRTFRVDRLEPPRVDRRPLHASRAAGARTRPPSWSSASPGRRTATRRGSRSTRRREVARSGSRRTGATVEPIDAATCRYRTGDDDLAWLALRSRCSASTSRSTGRPSSPRTCRRWARG